MGVEDGEVTGAEYEVVVRGRIGAALVRSLDDLEVRPEGCEATGLRGWVPDQAALHGLLRRLDDLGLEVLSVRRLPDEHHASGGGRPSVPGT